VRARRGADNERARWSRRRRVVVGVVAFVLVVVATAGGFGLVTWRHIDRVSVTFPGSPSGGTTYLLIGSDSRAFVSSASDRARFGSGPAERRERADVMLLVRTLSGGGLRVLGIPRDLLTQLPDGSPTRMTLTLLQGPQAVVDTLCDSLGIGVDHLAVMHFDGLRRLVDRVGGVTVHVAAPERDRVTGLSLRHAGANHLDGQQALAFVRSRQLEELRDGHWRPVAPSAYARSEQARTVLVQLGSRLHLSAASPISSLRKLWTLSGAITVDNHSGVSDLRNLSHALGRLGTAHDEQIPVIFHPGAVPIADLQPSAGAKLEAFQGPPQHGCSLRTLQTSGGAPESTTNDTGSQGGTP